MNPSRPTVVGLILAATVLFVVGIVWEKNSGEHHRDSVAQAAETASEEAAESGDETHEEIDDEAGDDEKVLGIKYESTSLVILAVLASLGLAAVVWFARDRWLLLVVAAAMLAFALFDIAEVFHQVDRDQAGIAVLATFVAVLHLAAGLGSAQLRRQPI